jgi:hypothetical protein
MVGSEVMVRVASVQSLPRLLQIAHRREPAKREAIERDLKLLDAAADREHPRSMLRAWWNSLNSTDRIAVGALIIATYAAIVSTVQAIIVPLWRRARQTFGVEIRILKDTDWHPMPVYLVLLFINRSAETPRL